MILQAMEWLWPGDWLVRRAIRALNAGRLRELRQGGVEAQCQRKQALIGQLAASPLALLPEQANEQHYEVPAQFFEQVLGSHLKYSCGYWSDFSGPPEKGLDASERAMLELYLERALLVDGQRVLDLGCGWGSLSLFLAERFPGSRITGVSNSNSQRLCLLDQARRRGLTNFDVVTEDINRLELPSDEFDRIVSIEMFEHVRNYASLFQRLREALKVGGKLFVHVFAHREHPYTFDPRGRGGPAGDWMEREFFSGGTMPSLDLFLHFQGSLELENQWVVSGRHYQRTSEAWLARMRNQRRSIQIQFKKVYGRRWRRYWLGWQLFFLACAELFGHGGGEEWLIHHLRWHRPN